MNRLYKAILPDPAAGEFSAKRTLLFILAEKIRSLAPPTDISEVQQEIEDVLDSSIASDGYIIRWQKQDERIDLSKVDFEGLKQYFEKSKKKKATESLKNEIKKKLEGMMQRNKTRADFYE